MKAIAYIICYFIYPFSFLFVRKKHKIAFGGFFRKIYSDNSKYLFIYCQQYRKDLNSAWLSLSRKTVKDIRAIGLKAYFTLSPKGIWHALTSKYWFFNSYTSDIMFCLSGGAMCVNLWHGLALKSIEFNIRSGLLAERYRERKFKEVFYHPECFKRPDWVLSSTPFQSEMFASAFRIDQSHCLELGYPRNEILTFDEKTRKAHIASFENESTKRIIAQIVEGDYKKVFIYMPTWRDSQREIFVQSFDLSKMNKMLLEKNSLLILKPHANTIVDHIDQYSNIILADSKADVYPILPYTDVLITDYSSVLYDYVLMEDKDVILYLYDYEEYVKDRDLYYPFDENVVGKRTFCFEELYSCIEKEDYSIDLEKKKEIVEKFWGKSAHYDSNKEILSFFFHTQPL